jgi:predicted MFS family arabinose efflux permease
MLGGMALMAANLALMAMASQAWMLYPVVGLIALGSNLGIPALTSLLSARVGPGEQGRLMGAMQTVLNLALVGGPLLAGLAFDHLGAAAPYGLGAGIALLALAVAWSSEGGGASG